MFAISVTLKDCIKVLKSGCGHHPFGDAKIQVVVGGNDHPVFRVPVVERPLNDRFEVGFCKDFNPTSEAALNNLPLVKAISNTQEMMGYLKTILSERSVDFRILDIYLHEESLEGKYGYTKFDSCSGKVHSIHLSIFRVICNSTHV